MGSDLRTGTRLAMAALPVVLLTGAWSTAASAAPGAAARTGEAAAVPAQAVPAIARPFAVEYRAGSTVGTYEITQLPLGVTRNLRVNGSLRVAGADECYGAQVGVRNNGIWSFKTAAVTCGDTAVRYTAHATGHLPARTTFGIRVCRVAGATPLDCGDVKVLS